MTSTGARLGISLPPMVDGPIQGDIYVSIDRILWYKPSEIGNSNINSNYNKKKGISCIRVLWWGQDENDSILFKPSLMSNESEMNHTNNIKYHSYNTVRFPIKCSIDNIKGYLSDMRTMVFDVYHFDDTDKEAIEREHRKIYARNNMKHRKPVQPRKPIGHSVLDLKKLSDNIGTLERPGIDKCLPIVEDGLVIGMIHVKIIVNHALVSESLANKNININKHPLATQIVQDLMDDEVMSSNIINDNKMKNIRS